MNKRDKMKCELQEAGSGQVRGLVMDTSIRDGSEKGALLGTLCTWRVDT